MILAGQGPSSVLFSDCLGFSDRCSLFACGHLADERFLALCLAFTFGLRSYRQYSLPGAHYYIETHGQMVAE